MARHGRRRPCLTTVNVGPEIRILDWPERMEHD